MGKALFPYDVQARRGSEEPLAKILRDLEKTQKDKQQGKALNRLN
ncbi:hypothetical protein L345_10054, partial [Ophiophagus hannah]